MFADVSWINRNVTFEIVNATNDTGESRVTRLLWKCKESVESTDNCVNCRSKSRKLNTLDFTNKV